MDKCNDACMVSYVDLVRKARNFWVGDERKSPRRGLDRHGPMSNLSTIRCSRQLFVFSERVIRHLAGQLPRQ